MNSYFGLIDLSNRVIVASRKQENDLGYGTGFFTKRKQQIDETTRS